MNLNNLKYKTEYEYYNSYCWDKVRYWLYRERFLKWISKEKAIIPWNLRTQGKIKENWRICNKCWLFKEWSEYSKSKNKYTTTCKECRNKVKAEYRKTQHWKQMAKNHHIKYRADYKKLKHEREKSKEWRIKNKEHLILSRRKWFQENKKDIQERHKKTEYEKYLQWEFVIYNWNKCRILQDYNKKEWLLIKVWEFKIFVKKYQVKPFIQVNKYIF